uniref:Uncharacterized protein n=1 Tax=Molossus molossus TaxID=27622 RepID=A0A7J8GKK2_MOLMO|nr:hypothetical protein HJG59_011414 [Molossus molossus]
MTLGSSIYNAKEILSNAQVQASGPMTGTDGRARPCLRRNTHAVRPPAERQSPPRTQIKAQPSPLSTWEQSRPLDRKWTLCVLLVSYLVVECIGVNLVHTITQVSGAQFHGTASVGPAGKRASLRSQDAVKAPFGAEHAAGAGRRALQDDPPTGTLTTWPAARLALRFAAHSVGQAPGCLGSTYHWELGLAE